MFLSPELRVRPQKLPGSNHVGDKDLIGLMPAIAVSTKQSLPGQRHSYLSQNGKKNVVLGGNRSAPVPLGNISSLSP